jgi:putative NIF3 family GTP cyclohydrolase 1 type 2
MKLYYIQFNIGKAKYVISYHNGIDKHKDGSNFYGIRIFHNKKKLADFEKQLLNSGYIYKY